MIGLAVVHRGMQEPSVLFSQTLNEWPRQVLLPSDQQQQT